MEQSQKFIEAKKRVKEMKGFYNHLTAYIIINLALIIIRIPVVIFFADRLGDRADKDFLEWIDLNVLITPLIWGIALFIHFIAVFGKKTGFIRNWEERKIQEFLREEDERSRKNWQ